MRHLSRISVVAIALMFSGCPETPPVVEDGGMTGCTGTIGCECKADSTCDTGECVGGTCTDCRRGTAACVCRANGTCDTGLRCEGATCTSCPAGQEGCACEAGGACGSGLICSSNVCVRDTCVAGSNACPCRDTDPKCDGAGYCDGTNRCQTCSSDVVGCACDGNAMCQGGTVCDATSTKCRAPVSCAQLVNNGSCLPNQACSADAGIDATCIAAMCNPGYLWNGTACQACTSPDCGSEPSCDAADGGLASTCAAQNRECVTTGQVGSCAGCLRGFTQNTAGACVPVPSCGNTTCGITEYCDRLGTPQCLPFPCPTGQVRNSIGNCTTCGATMACQAPGLSGRVWPFMTNDSVCVCETLDNHFMPGGETTLPKQCDADNDGWVHEDADSPTIRIDPALRQNSRCQILTAERVRLTDEYGIHVDVLSCTEGLLKASYETSPGVWRNGGLQLFADGGLVPQPDGGVACTGIVPLRLLETQRNDVQASLPTGVNGPTPPYGSVLADGGAFDGTTRGGRYLRANELNSLTKACVTDNGNFNDDGVEDRLQAQTVVTGPDDRARLHSFAYFIETHEAWWQSTSGSNGKTGILNIRERSRCDVNFPLHYSTSLITEDLIEGVPNDGYAAGSPYWRNCARGRDTAYNAASPQPNFDFALWSCDGPGGGTAGCNDIVPPAHSTLIAPVNSDTVKFRNFGLCELDGGLPADRRWRGMQHHSQFKCVSTANSADFAPGVDSKMTFNECVALPCGVPNAPACSKALGTGPQTRQPTIQCLPVNPATRPLGFATVNFRRTPAYERGCVDESSYIPGSGEKWNAYICPYPEFSDGGAGEFGRYTCFGLGSNFLWAPSSGGPLRATMFWSQPDGGTPNASTFSPAPLP